MLDRPLSLCGCYLDDGTLCDLPAVADWHDPEDPYIATPVCEAHAAEADGEVVRRQ